MLTWISESNKYEEVYKSYFGDCEITIVKFMAGGYSAWVRKIPTAVSIFKKSYNYELSLEEVQKDFIESLRNHLDERASYWNTLYHDLWREEGWIDEVEE